MPFLAIAGNLPAWATWIIPLGTGIEWLLAFIGLVSGVGIFALFGVEWLQNRSNWGAMIISIFAGVAGVGFAAAAVGMGNTLGAALNV